MLKTKSENKAVEVKMDDIGIQTNTIKTVIKLTSLSAKEMNMVQHNFSKYLMNSNLAISLN